MPIVSSWMRTTETKTAQMASERVIFFTFGKTELLELFCQSVFIDAVFSCVGDEESDDGNDNLHVPELQLGVLHVLSRLVVVQRRAKNILCAHRERVVRC
jgi:hypothetical protein